MACVVKVGRLAVSSELATSVDVELSVVGGVSLVVVADSIDDAAESEARDGVSDGLDWDSSLLWYTFKPLIAQYASLKSAPLLAT